MTADPVVVRGAVRPFIAAGTSAAALAALGVGAWRTGGPGPGVVTVLAAASVALAVLLLDLPRRTELGPDGIVRVCLLRRERIVWDRVVAVERQRRRLAGPGSGGLVLRGRRGRWLVTTVAEPPAVHAALVRLLAEHAPAVRMRAEPPAVELGRG